MALPASDTFEAYSTGDLAGNGVWMNGLVGTKLTIANDGSGGKWVRGGTADSFAFDGTNTYTSAHYSEVQIRTIASGFGGPCVRCSVNNCYLAVTDGSTIYVQKIVASSVTTLTTFTHAVSSGDFLKIAVDGSDTITVYHNVAAVHDGTTGSVGTISGGGALTGGAAGIIVWPNVAECDVDNWYANNVGGSGGGFFGTPFYLLNVSSGSF